MKHVLLVTVLLLGASADARSAEIVYNFDNGCAAGWVFPFNSGMTQAPGGDWSVTNGTLVQSFFGDNNVGLVNGRVVSTQTVSADVKSVGYAGVVLWYNQVDESWANYVSVTLNTQAGLWVTEYVNGAVLRTTYNIQWWSGDWSRVTVGADASTHSLAISVDDPLMGQYEFTHLATTPYLSGLSGVVAGNEVGYFDNFRLAWERPAAVPEPASLLLLVTGFAVGAAVRRTRVRRQ